MAWLLVAAMVVVAAALLCADGDVDWPIAGATALLISLSTRSLMQEARQLADVVPTVDDFDKGFLRPHTAPSPTEASRPDTDENSAVESETTGDERRAVAGASAGATPSTSWRGCRARARSGCGCCGRNGAEGYRQPARHEDTSDDVNVTSSAQADGAAKPNPGKSPRARALALARDYETLLHEPTEAMQREASAEGVRRRLQVGACCL